MLHVGLALRFLVLETVLCSLGQGCVGGEFGEVHFHPFGFRDLVLRTRLRRRGSLRRPPKLSEFVPISQLPPQDQLPAAPLLVTAYAFVWVVLFGYVVSVARRLTKVQREVERLEADIKRGTRT